MHCMNRITVGTNLECLFCGYIYRKERNVHVERERQREREGRKEKVGGRKGGRKRVGEERKEID